MNESAPQSYTLKARPVVCIRSNLPSTLASAAHTPLSTLYLAHILPWQSFANGLSRDPPSVGDMLIYPIQPPDMPYGHVAIIVALEASGHLPGYVSAP